MKFYSGFIVVILLFSCATPTLQQSEVDQAHVEREAALQQQNYYKKLLENQARIGNIAYRLKVSNVDLCPKKSGPFFGFHYISKDMVDKKMWEAVGRTYGDDKSVRVVSVIKGSPADKAGIRAMDTLVSIEGKPVQSGKQLAKRIKKIQPGTPTTFVLVNRPGFTGDCLV